jgi:hypothetical protein
VYITVITEDQNRAAVAKLHKVTTKSIFEVPEIAREARTRAKAEIPVLENRSYNDILRSCHEVLSSMEMPPRGFGFLYDWWLRVLAAKELFEEEDVESILAILKATSEALGLAIVSYSGTHIRDFNQSDESTGHEVFILPAMDFKNEERKAAPIISFRRRRLMCMDAFLGNREVWVFQEGSDMSRNEPLWLSTGIEELNDQWGPCWKSVRDAEPGQIQSIEIGNGCILPWYNGHGLKPEDNLPFLRARNYFQRGYRDGAEDVHHPACGTRRVSRRVHDFHLAIMALWKSLRSQPSAVHSLSWLGQM